MKSKINTDKNLPPEAWIRKIFKTAKMVMDLRKSIMYFLGFKNGINSSAQDFLNFVYFWDSQKS